MHEGEELTFRELVMSYTTPQDLVGLPACAVRAGFDALGIPVGVQFTAPALARRPACSARPKGYSRRRQTCSRGVRRSSRYRLDRSLFRREEAVARRARLHVRGAARGRASAPSRSLPKGRRSSSCSRPRSTPPTSQSRPGASRPAARRCRTSPGSRASAASCSRRASRPGTRVWASGRGLGVARDGAFAERFAVADEVLVEVPEAAADLVAAALGQVGLAAWMSLSWLAPVRPGEVVLVLGATGSVGSVAVQVAKLLGAGRVVAVGRDQRPARGGRARSEPTRPSRSTATTSRSGWPQAVDGAPPTLVLDLLCGPALEAARGRRRPGSTDRPRRPVGGADGHLRLGPRARQAAADPRATRTSPCRSTRSPRATRT